LVRRSSFRRERERDRWFSEFKKLGKGKGKRPDGFTTYIRKLFCPLRNQKARGLRRCGHGRKTTPLSSPTIRLWASKDALPISPTTLVRLFLVPGKLPYDPSQQERPDSVL